MYPCGRWFEPHSNRSGAELLAATAWARSPHSWAALAAAVCSSGLSDLRLLWLGGHIVGLVSFFAWTLYTESDLLKSDKLLLTP